MAYSGLPSKACAHCRQRRIRCNLAEPECAQCRRAGKTCPGYRDQLSLIFRDENAKVIRKASAKTNNTILAERKRLPRVVERGRQELNDWQVYSTNICQIAALPAKLKLKILSNTASPPSIPTSLFLNHDVRALVTSSCDLGFNFFLYRYMTGSSMTGSCPASTLTPPPSPKSDIFASALWRGISKYEPFLDAISCVGLAGLSNINHDQEMMRMARLKYAITLQRVHTSLQDPENADIGYVVKAVMLLTIFELVSCDLQSPGSWVVHLDGATALLQSYGFQIFQYEFDPRLKLQFFFSQFIKFLLTGQKFPSSMNIWPRRWGASLMPADSPVSSLAEIIIRFIDLRAAIRSGETTDANTIARSALLLEAELAHWHATLPPVWDYETRIVPETDAGFAGTYNGEYHLYQDQWIAKMWDHYRWARIMVHELILTYLMMLPLPPVEKERQQLESLAVISHLTSHICASAWSQLYLLDSTMPASAPQLTSVFMLLWHLRVAGSAVGAPEALHEWVLQVVKNIGETMGIRQTEMVVKMTVMQREHWKSTSTLSFAGRV